MPRFPKKMIPYEMKKLGIYLKQLRDEADLSIRDVARECGISPSYLFKIEGGNFLSTLGIHTLLKFSKFYNMPISAILKEVGLIDYDEYDLPDFLQYMRAKYRYSPQAIRDIEMAKRIVDEKYKKA